MIQSAEGLRREILPEAPYQGVDEDTVDKLVMFWSR